MRNNHILSCISVNGEKAGAKPGRDQYQTVYTADIDGGEEITENHLVKDIVSIIEDQFR